jgi:hypothetical protein
MSTKVLLSSKSGGDAVCTASSSGPLQKTVHDLSHGARFEDRATGRKTLQRHREERTRWENTTILVGPPGGKERTRMAGTENLRAAQ